MRNTTTLILSLLISGGLLLTAATPASAHEPGYAVERYHISHYPPAWPYWLRADRDFHRWYGYRQHRYDRRIGWQRLYRDYRHDRHYHRKLRQRQKHRGRHYRRRHH